MYPGNVRMGGARPDHSSDAMFTTNAALLIVYKIWVTCTFYEQRALRPFGGFASIRIWGRTLGNTLSRRAWKIGPGL